MLNFREQRKHPNLKHIVLGEIEIRNTRSNLNSSFSTNNKTRINRYVSTTRNRNHQLRHDLTLADWRKIFFEDFRMTCPVTKYPSPFYKLNMGHFIPIHWGIGGSYVGNVFPIYGKLNTSMRHYNPLDYFEWENDDYPIHEDGVEFLIKYLAKSNGLTVEAYRDYVNSCYEYYRNKTY